jgi:hypothetical protein
LLTVSGLGPAGPSAPLLTRRPAVCDTRRRPAPPPTPKGPFELAIAGGFSAYRAPRPQLLVVSSAGVERNAVIGDDLGERGRGRVCVCVCVRVCVCVCVRVRM